MPRQARVKDTERKIRRGIQTDDYELMTDEDKRKRANVIEWITMFRRNWNIYIEYVLGVPLKPFQKIMFWLACQSNVFFAMMSRGCSKSWWAGGCGIVKIMLYPYAEVVITSSTVDQANKLFNTKILNEWILKLSPYLKDMYERGYLVVKQEDDGYRLTNNLNGAWLKVLPCTDAARGSRSCMLIYEEARLLKKTMIDSVFEPMAHPRQAKYIIMENSPYAKNPRWLEECQSIYITSARYKFEWFWKTFKDCVEGMLIDKRTNYAIYTGDIFTAIDNGLKTWGDYRKMKKMSSDYDWRMESLNEMIGEAEDGFFDIKHFVENQVIDKCWRPPTIEDLYMDRDIGNIPKKDNEIRLIVADFAFANTISRTDNDNTFILCMSLHWRGRRFERHIDYCETHEASDSLGAADRLRELRIDYDADYMLMDSRNGGETLFNYLTEPKTNEARLGNWEYHGLGLADKYQVVTQAKIDDYMMRTVDRDYIHCLIPFTATGDQNSQMWLELRKQLDMGNIKLLISMQDRQHIIEEDGSYFDMTAEQVARELLPYGQTDALIQEAVALKQEYRQDKLKLTEPRTGTKDRIVCLSYINWVASLIENEWLRQQQEAEFDISDWRLVF